MLQRRFRSRSSIPLTPLAELNAVLSQYPRDCRPRSDELPQEFHGFSNAVVYRVATDAGVFAARRWGNPNLNLARLNGLHRLLRFVRACGVSPVAVPLATRDGSTFVRCAGYCWQLEPWMPGRADYWETPSRAKLQSAMHVLAEWHRAARRFKPHPVEREWFRSKPAAESPGVAQRLEKLRRWQSGTIDRVRKCISAAQAGDELCELAGRVLSCFDRIAGRIEAELQSVREPRFRLQPSLRDVWHDHVLFTGHDVTGLIDPSACRTESVATDLARLVGSLVEDDAQARGFAMDAYAERNPLSPQELALVGVFDRSTVLLGALSWLDRCFLERREFPDRTAVTMRLSGLTARLERLAAER